MSKAEMQQELQQLEARLEAARFSYSVSSWSSGPGWRDHISKLEQQIFDLKKEMEATNA